MKYYLPFILLFSYGLLRSQVINKVELNKINQTFDYELVCNFEMREKSIQIIDTIKFGILDTILTLDLNRDGFKDIVVKISDQREKAYGYWFDSFENDFKKISKFEEFGEFLLFDSGMFFFYKRKGCADGYWSAYLPKVSNGVLTIEREIRGDFCRDAENWIITVVDFNRECKIIREFSCKELKGECFNKMELIKKYLKK